MKRLAALAAALACAALAHAQPAPPIPHPVDGYLVTRTENNCLECHDKPRDIGRKRATGAPAPAPKSHYASLEGKPQVDDAHYRCTSCHAVK